MPDSLPDSESAPATAIADPQTSRGTEHFRQQMGHISRQSSVFFAGTVFTAAAAYLFKVYLARVLGAEALGIYALGMTIVGFLSAFNGLGLPQAAVRFVAAYSATGKTKLLGAFLARSVFLLLASNLLVAGILVVSGRWIAVRLYHTPRLGAYMGLFALIMVFGTMNAFFGQVLGGYKDVAKRTLITNFIGTPATMVLTILLVSWGLGLWGYISAQVLAAVLTTALLTTAAWQLTPKLCRTPGAWNQTFEKEVVSFSIASFGMVFLQFLLAQADKVLIGFYLNARDVGIYAVAMGLVAFVPSVLQAVNQIFAPTIAELYARQDRDVLRRIYQTLTKWIVGFTVPLVAMLLLFSHPLMRIFGPDFEMGWSVLSIGSLGELVNCGVGSVGFLLLMSGNERRLLRIQIVMGVVIVGLNILLIPHWGIVGAAVASAAISIVSNLWYLKDVHQALGLFPYTRSYYRLLLPFAGAFSVLWFVRSQLHGSHSVPMMGMALLSAYAAFGAVALLVGLDADDRTVANAVWARLRALIPGAR